RPGRRIRPPEGHGRADGGALAAAEPELRSGVSAARDGLALRVADHLIPGENGSTTGSSMLRIVVPGATGNWKTSSGMAAWRSALTRFMAPFQFRAVASVRSKIGEEWPIFIHLTRCNSPFEGPWGIRRGRWSVLVHGSSTHGSFPGGTPYMSSPVDWFNTR